MKRLTPKKVQAAYKKTGFEPCQDFDWIPNDDGVICKACPAFAVARAGGLDDYHCFDEDDYPEAYVMGFVQAIDGGDPWEVCVEEDQKKNLNKGYQDGLKVRDVLWPKKTKKKAKK